MTLALGLIIHTSLEGFAFGIQVKYLNKTKKNLNYYKINKKFDSRYILLEYVF